MKSAIHVLAIAFNLSGSAALAQATSPSANPFNYVWCNDGDFVLENECSNEPGADGHLVNQCTLAIEISGFRADGLGVVKYFETAGALAASDVHASQAYDPVTRTYHDALYSTLRAQSQTCAVGQPCFYYFNRADTIDFGRGHIIYDAGGFRVYLKTANGGEVNWRYETCETSWLANP